MVKLALEIPTSRLKAWAPLIDLDFILAHKVLEDEKYARFFKERPEAREVILDNSTHEFGKPLPFEDLARAAKLTSADYVIAPDIVHPNITTDQYHQNIRWVSEASSALNGTHMLAGVLCGHSIHQRRNWLIDNAPLVEMLCFSFHMPQRLEWWKDFEESPVRKMYKRVHLLGMISVEELKKWVKIAERTPEIEFSFDTSKPLKWGVQGKRLQEFKPSDTLRGGSVNSKTILDTEEFTPEQESCIEDNIMYLKAICRGVA